MKRLLTLLFVLLLTLPFCTAVLAEGYTIAIPNDPTNGGRALLMLQANGLLSLAPDVGLTPTEADIVSNPLDLTFVKMDAVSIPANLGTVDYAVINPNFAQDAGLSIRDALLIENGDSPYANVLGVAAGHESDDVTKALAAALCSQQVADYINQSQYNLACAFDQPTNGYDSDVDYAALQGQTILVAATPAIHSELLQVAAGVLALRSVTLSIREVYDYVSPMVAVDSGEVQANFFAHKAYLDSFNANNGTDIRAIHPVMIEPMGLYGGKLNSLPEVSQPEIIEVLTDVLYYFDVPAGEAFVCSFMVPAKGYYSIFPYNSNVAMRVYENGTLLQEYPNSFAAGTQLTIELINDGDITQEVPLKIFQYGGKLVPPTRITVDGQNYGDYDRIRITAGEPAYFQFDPVEGAEYYEVILYSFAERQIVRMDSNEGYVVFHDANLDAENKICMIYPRADGWITGAYHCYLNVEPKADLPSEISGALSLGNNWVSVQPGQPLRYTFTVPDDGYYDFLSDAFDGTLNMQLYDGNTCLQHGCWRLEGCFSKDQELNLVLENTGSTVQDASIMISHYYGFLDNPTNVAINGVPVQEGDVIDVVAGRSVTVTFDEVLEAEYYWLVLRNDDGEPLWNQNISGSGSIVIFGTNVGTGCVKCQLLPHAYNWNTQTGFTFYINLLPDDDPDIANKLMIGENDISVPAEEALSFEFTVPHNGYFMFVLKQVSNDLQMQLSNGELLLDQSNRQMSGWFSEGQRLTIRFDNTGSTLRNITLVVKHYYGTLDPLTNVTINGVAIDPDSVIDVVVNEPVHIAFDAVKQATHYELYVYGDDNEYMTMHGNDQSITFTKNAGARMVRCALYPRAQNWLDNGTFFYINILTEKPAENVLTMPSGLTTVGDYAFAGTAATRIVFSGEITEIAENAFADSDVTTLVGGGAVVVSFAQAHGYQYIAAE